MNEYDILNELSDGEDEFEVDLMACGCRVAPTGIKINLEIEDILRIYKLDTKKMINLIGALIDTARIDSTVLFELAEKVSRGELQEGSEKEGSEKEGSEKEGFKKDE